MIIETKTPSFRKAEIGPDFAQFFRENGYAVVADALSEEEVHELNEETVALCRGRRGDIHNFELPPENISDEEALKRVLCIHHPHKVSPLIQRSLAHPSLLQALTHIISPNLKCLQSMLFIKAAGKPGQAWHQDEDYIATRDRSLTGAWIALDDATTENGCLWVIPGSHKPGILWPQYPQDDPRFDCNLESYDFPYTDNDAVPVEVARGSLVLFNGYLLHRSLPNLAASGFRRCLVNHYASAETFVLWGEGLPRKDYRDFIMVAGEDPYAWKGNDLSESISHCHIRRAGDGGCGPGRMDLEEFKAAVARNEAKPL